MKLAVVNAGSGSQKIALFDLPRALPEEPVEPVWEAAIDATAPGQPEGRLVVRVRAGGAEPSVATLPADLPPEERIGRLLARLFEGDDAPLPDPGDLAAVGHRIVHGADRFTAATPIDAQVETAIEELAAFAPLHNPVGLAGVRAARRLCPPSTRAFAVFDTAFHHTLPAAAATYPGPRAWRDRGIRRYGFHGTSFRWAADRAARLLGRAGDPELRLVLCHLGGGCSLCATRGGRSVDTTMGFTPLDGIAMCTRPGSLDPGILLHLMREGADAGELARVLHHECGLKGLAGDGDTRTLLPRVEAGDADARLAWEVFLHRLRAGIAGMVAALGDWPHALVFTDAIAEGVPRLRTEACRGLGWLSLSLDEARNARAEPDTDLATDGSAVRLLLIHSREAWQIARECHALAIHR